MQPDPQIRSAEVLATQVAREIQLDAAQPAKEWQSAEPVRFDTDWQGRNGDRGLETEVRVLWSPEMLFLRFVCHYREIFVFDDSDPNGRRDYLWDRDVAEAFLQPPESMVSAAGIKGRAGLGRTAEGGRPHMAGGEEIRYEKVEGDFDAPYASYKEFEIAPNGMWVDLDIVPSGRGDLRSGLTRSVHVDQGRKVWTAELAIPMKSLTARFNPSETWRVNFYRVEGKVEPRKYMAWQPTMASQPNFHVPEKFGTMRFSSFCGRSTNA
jgi:alpha-galactosidase